MRVQDRRTIINSNGGSHHSDVQWPRRLSDINNAINGQAGLDQIIDTASIQVSQFIV
jgi:hypothetical protein